MTPGDAEYQEAVAAVAAAITERQPGIGVVDCLRLAIAAVDAAMPPLARWIRADQQATPRA